MSPITNRRLCAPRRNREEFFPGPSGNEAGGRQEHRLHAGSPKDFERFFALLNRGESTRVEFKLRAPSVPRLAKLICAFANTSGGHILMGVDDDAKVEGVEEVREIREAIGQALGLCSPVPEVEVTELALDEGGVVVMCEVRKGNEKPYRVSMAKGGESVYIRVGSAVMPIAPKEDERIAREDIVRSRMSLQPIHRKILKIVERNSGTTVRKIAQSCNLSAYRVRKALVSLLQSGMVVEKNPGRYTIR